MREFVDAFARAMNIDRLDEDYDRTMRRLEETFRSAVKEVLYDLLDPANPVHRDRRLMAAVRRAAMGPPGPPGRI